MKPNSGKHAKTNRTFEFGENPDVASRWHAPVITIPLPKFVTIGSKNGDGSSIASDFRFSIQIEILRTG